MIKALFLLLVLLATGWLHAQRARGELRIEVRDTQGEAVPAHAELVSEVNQFRREFEVERGGRSVVQELSFGVYRLTITASGFAPVSSKIEIRSEVPVNISVRLSVAPMMTEVQVNDSATLVDPYRTGTQYSIGHRSLEENTSARPGRELSDLVDELPGWIYEANGVLHPRGSEYDVQYVVDGVPVTENRSPGFAPPLDPSDVESLRVLTADYPAEYGRKLGGIIEVNSQKNVANGLHGRVNAEGGSFLSAGGGVAISYAAGKNVFALSGNGSHTGRYLDPPVLENFTNDANLGGFSGSWEGDLSERDRFRISATHDFTRFMVPNYLVQEAAGQRQQIANIDTGGQVSFQHLFSPELLMSASGSVRDASSDLRSNALSTPVIVQQDRGYREGYARVDLSGHRGRQDWKFGADSIFNPVHEALQYKITDPSQFEPGTKQNFQFSDHRWDVEPSAFVQDQIRLGNWNVSVGIRYDHYRFVVQEMAWSPRVGISRYLPSLGLLLHASYDRVFQTPAQENLLLASSEQLDSLNPVVARLPIRPGRGNFYEAGVSKALMGKLRLDANVFRRDFRNYADDDVLLDTGVSFPIAFDRARIVGEELRLEVPEWRQWSGFLSYTNQSGLGQGPIVGGLFLGSDTVGQLSNAKQFAVSQDQRNTARGRIRFQAPRRVWFAAGGQYGSGLPAEVGDTDYQTLLAQYGGAVLGQMNFAKSRVRPNFSLEAAAGIEIYHKEQRSASFRIETENLTNRLNLINFASLFSGTAIAAPRSISSELQLTF